MEFVSNNSGTVLSIGYGMFAVKLESEDFKKVIYVHKYPPIVGSTKIPDFSVQTPISDINSLLSGVNLRKETLLNFWSSKSLYQANGDWKGGEWGSNNLCTTDVNWCTGAFIGDKVSIDLVKYGIIPYKTRLSKPFGKDDEIIVGSESATLSCNVTITLDGTEKTYSCYVCDEPMGQNALDVLFIWKNKKGKRFVKILRRGNPHPNVDMPLLQMPGAGEHREPGNNISFKSEVLRAVKEEIGIHESTLMDCYLIPIGIYDDDKRDPRYWSYSAEQDGQIIEFGIKRKSNTNVYVLYIESDSDTEPIEADPTDFIEVGSKKWVDLDNHTLANKELWMIPEHSTYFTSARIILDRFDDLSIEHKLPKKIMLS